MRYAKSLLITLVVVFILLTLYAGGVWFANNVPLSEYSRVISLGLLSGAIWLTVHQLFYGDVRLLWSHKRQNEVRDAHASAASTPQAEPTALSVGGERQPAHDPLPR